jgi:hypothetical protein
MCRTKIKPYVKKDLKKNTEEFLEQLGFVCVSHPSSLFKQIYIKDNLTIHVEEKLTTDDNDRNMNGGVS